MRSIALMHCAPGCGLGLCRGIVLFEYATRDVRPTDTLARKRSRVLALQLTITSLGGAGPPELGEHDEDESEAREMARLDSVVVQCASILCPTDHRDLPRMTPIGYRPYAGKFACRIAKTSGVENDSTAALKADAFLVGHDMARDNASIGGGAYVRVITKSPNSSQKALKCVLGRPTHDRYLPFKIHFTPTPMLIGLARTAGPLPARSRTSLSGVFWIALCTSAPKLDPRVGSRERPDLPSILGFLPGSRSAPIATPVERLEIENASGG